MPVAEFYAWLERMPALERLDTLEAVNRGVIIGQRGVSDEDFKRTMRDLRKPYVAPAKRMSKKAFEEFAAKVEGLNQAWREIEQMRGNLQ